MKIKIFIFSLIFLLFLSLSSVALAQEETGYATFCLKSENCAESSPDPKCSDPVSHRVKLTFVPNEEFYNNQQSLILTNVYIIECIDTGGTDQFNEQICTTGNSTLDVQLFDEDNVSKLGDTLSRVLELGRDGRPSGSEWDTGYEFDELTNHDTGEKYAYRLPDPGKQQQIISLEDGTIPVLEWESFTPANYYRKFYAVYEMKPTGGGEEEYDSNGNANTQQQGTLIVTPQPTQIIGDETVCVAIDWDPYGRVFDSRSLEPIPEVVVELQKKRDNGSFTKVNPFDPKDVLSSVLKNPYVTESDGYFSFIVKDGTYKLDLPSAYNQNLNIVTDIAKIHPNYTKIYSEIYPANTGDEIIQEGKIQHRDIPVEMKDGPANFPVKLMTGSYDLGKRSGKLYVSGRASHPFTMVKAYSKKISNNPAENVRGRLLLTISSDNFGRFSFTVDQNGLAKDEYFGEVELQKTNLTTFQLSQDKKTIGVNPILNYIEGYAYDEKGKMIPNAAVSIYFTFSSKPFYQTLADEKGYYRIASANLSSLPYNIRYSLPNGQTIKTTTAKFINDNAQYLTSKKINLYEQNNKVKTPSLPLKSTDLNKQQPTNIPGSTQTNSKNDLVLVIIVILVLILGATALIGVYFYQKGKRPTSF